MAVVVRAYDFISDFEKALVYLAATSESFMLRVGILLESEAFALPASKLIVAQVAALEKENVKPSATIVLQRLRSISKTGKLTHDDILLAQSFFDEMERSGKGKALDETAITNEVVPILRKRRQDAALLKALDGKARGNLDTKALREELEAAEGIGVHDKSVGLEMGDSMWAAIEARRLIARRRTGISELDTQLNGGAVPGALSFVIGGPGDGKSMYLSHIAANCIRQRGLVGCVTLEVDEVEWQSRVIANLMDTPVTEVQGPNNKLIRRAFEERQEKGDFGAVVVKDMTGRITKVQDLKDWNNACEDKYGRPFDLIVVDYADKMEPHKACKGMYEGMLYVYDGLRMWAAEKRLWPLWTASQSKAKGKDQHTLGLYDAADSTHKVRVADLVVTLNVNKETGEIRYWIAKHRLGKSDIMIGPLPIDFSRGRMAPVPEYISGKAWAPEAL